MTTIHLAAATRKPRPEPGVRASHEHTLVRHCYAGSIVGDRREVLCQSSDASSLDAAVCWI